MPEVVPAPDVVSIGNKELLRRGRAAQSRCPAPLSQQILTQNFLGNEPYQLDAEISQPEEPELDNDPDRRRPFIGVI